MILSRFNPVAGSGLRIFGQRRKARFHDRVAQLRIARHHDILLRVLFIRPGSRLLPFPGLHGALGMGHPGAHLEQHGRVKPLGKLVGQFGEFERLSAVRRLKHRELRRLSVMAGILLVLRAVHAGVIRHANDHPGVYAGIGNREQRVSSNVEPHVLHAAKAPLAG